MGEIPADADLPPAVILPTGGPTTPHPVEKTVITAEILLAIAMIGHDRMPTEACGVLLPTEFKGKRVFEMPNRSMTPHDTFTMLGEDILYALEEYDGVWEDVTVWHTHPAGQLGPSRADVIHKSRVCGNLVVSLTSEPELALAFWY